MTIGANFQNLFKENSQAFKCPNAQHHQQQTIQHSVDWTQTTFPPNKFNTRDSFPIKLFGCIFQLYKHNAACVCVCVHNGKVSDRMAAYLCVVVEATTVIVPSLLEVWMKSSWLFERTHTHKCTHMHEKTVHVRIILMYHLLCVGLFSHSSQNPFIYFIFNTVLPFSPTSARLFSSHSSTRSTPFKSDLWVCALYTIC